MPQGYVGPIIVAQGDGTALTNTTTATSLLNGQAKATLGAQFIDVVGKDFRVTASGRMSTAASTPGNITFDIRLGSVIVATSQAIALATSQTNVTWKVIWDLTCRAVGSSTSANFMHTGILFTAGVTGSPIMIPATSPAVGTGFDSTAAQTVDFFGTWSAASASNTITLHQFIVESLN